MAASGATPIQIYYSTTASAVPTAGNLLPGELGLNIADMKLYCENSSGVVTLLASAGVLNTPLAVVGNSTAGAEIRLPEDTDNGSNYVALKAANSIASNLTFTLPSADGTSGQVLQTDGSGTLSFASVSSGPFPENQQTISADYTVTASKNASSVGPVTINTGIYVTVGTGQKWLIFN